MDYRIHPTRKFSGKVIVPGDKSISHRALILGAISNGKTEISHLLESDDVCSTQGCLEKLGVQFYKDSNKLIVEGVGIHGLQEYSGILNSGNSGTTLRTLMGLLAGQRFSTQITGDSSLCSRPMRRVADPLRQMGAQIQLENGDFAPMRIEGRPLHGSHHFLKIASAQIKTALLLAGLCAEGETQLTGLISSRDHTERMLPHFGASIQCDPNQIVIRGGQSLHGTSIQIPGDPSSAAFLMAAACLVGKGIVEIENLSLNPTRTGFFRILERMGATLEQFVLSKKPEPIGTVRVQAKELQAVQVSSEEIPSLIDEIPLIALLASQAKGQTIVSGAKELRVKETDRIEAIAKNLRRMGVTLETFEDGFSIQGPQKLIGTQLNSYQDHRIAMAFSVAGLVAEGVTEIQDAECVAISFPNFFNILNRLAYE